jgi:non-heme chloroperoxidase
MPYVTVGRENSGEIKIYFEDHGSGKPAVLIHGYPLNGRSWEKQIPMLLENGYRVITYDRRGFGQSSQPSFGYDYDTFAKDLDCLMTELDLRDVTLIGFSMGTGEIMRYLGTYGSSRVEKAVFIGTLGPYLRKASDNLEGVDPSVFDSIKNAIVFDRYAYLTQFFKDFYNYDMYSGKRISDQAIQAQWNVAALASPVATLKCVDTWGTDFRADLPKIDVPSLLIHGNADRILPHEVTAARFHPAVKNNRLVTIDGGPHNITWTHSDEVNAAILEFFQTGAVLSAA